jgi:hypothetical protein
MTMKNNPTLPMNIMVGRAGLLLLLLSMMNYQPCTLAQGTAFTYQGRLNDNGSPANGSNYGMVFFVYDAASGGSALGNLGIVSVPVSNGLFTVTLDFGAAVFTGAGRWLEIAVQKNGGPFITLNPRQPITPAPYAIYASGSGGAGISGTIPASALGNAWLLSGNSNTVSGQFIGTADDQPFDVRVNNVRVMRFRLNTDGGGFYTNSPNVIGGSSVNTSVNTSVVGATIAGGGGQDVNGNSYANKVTANFGTVGGGDANTASGYTATTVGGGENNTASSLYATVGGGDANTASGYSATVGGGEQNTASGYSATVGGGDQNTASGDYATVGGGEQNAASGYVATVGGGVGNTASGVWATVSGGKQNTASADNSFAAGTYANAKNDGAFVWADDNNFIFSSTTANQFRVRATGGTTFVTAIDGSGGVTAGVHVLAGDTAWSSISDKNAKKNFQPINAEAVLEKLAAIPVEQWNYKWESDTNAPHLGPMAQDFKAAFYPGRDDKTISTLEFDGVELAAIQGLNQKLERQIKAQNAQLKDKEAEIQELKQRLERLENATHK